MKWWQKLGAEDILVPASQPRSPLSLDEEVRPLLGAGGLEWAHALAIELTRQYVEGSIPELALSADFTRRLQISSEANVLGLLLALGSAGADPQPPQEALDFAQEAVTREVPIAAVLRGYRLGVEHWLRWCAPVIARKSDPAAHAEELQRAVTVGIRYIDRLSERMIAEYERELQRRATSGAAHRAALVRTVLAGEVVDAEEASDLLHYPLGGSHVALTLEAVGQPGNHVEAMEGEARSFASSVRASGLLTVATGLNTMDAWVATKAVTTGLDRPTKEHLLIGVGSARSGISGFIQSHTEARRASDIMKLASPLKRASVAYYDRMQLLSLLLKDVDEARAFVMTALGPLTHSDPRAEELRDTLLAFFEANKSYAAVARSSHLHKNTVVQRVARAIELAGRDVTSDLDVHIALKLVEALGESVLNGEDPSPFQTGSEGSGK